MTDQQGLPWTDAFLLGFEAMDDTHREFVEVVDRLLTCPDDDLAGAMRAFTQYLAKRAPAGLPMEQAKQMAGNVLECDALCKLAFHIRLQRP